MVRLASAMIPAWATELEVAEQSLERHRMAAFQPSSSATVRATSLSFQVFLYLPLDHSLLDFPKQFLGLPESQTDLLQSMLIALPNRRSRARVGQLRIPRRGG